ncbi:transposase [Synechocystis sp. PCC 6803]|uniref:Transposase n=5 Tax=Synechocystis TaxID=1142 RepID=Q55871_SYNY3|nr:transposase [Synechocystis sp. PCC 6803]AVP90679.1 IS701 family transposase [Synechocystis sp. IPPAS B-1465]BAL30414.1 transposase [Synechocystis sp. PCC 6803 substr. GT-I]BAL33583.1 transposase [Synechocystis sp. PCC 6803 substr. PCC-N]BAL36752.1 transposase [Synechocystis sp. PCC 6803 substr. PCC-P]
MRMRSFEYLHLGLIANIKRKTFAEIAKVVGLENGQGFDYFFGNSPWSLEEVRERRINKILSFAKGEAITMIIDETGDRKKGRKTDYVARQYIGNLGKIENGIVEVMCYGIIKGMTVPLISKVYKPETRLKEGDKYKNKPEIAGEIIKEIKELGFNIKVVLADSEYGESSENFVRVLEKENLEYVLAIRSNHGVWLGKEERVRANKWGKFEREFASGKSEIRYVREIIYGKRGEKRYWQVTDNKEKMPSNSTYCIMTKVSEIKYKEVGNLYGARNWIEYGLKQIKNELGWADFRIMDYSRIEKWREIVMSVYLMVSLQIENLPPHDNSLNKSKKWMEKHT